MNLSSVNVSFPFQLTFRVTPEKLEEASRRRGESRRNASAQLVEFRRDEREPDRRYVTWLSAKQ